MRIVIEVAQLLIGIYLWILIVRVAVSWVQLFAREWRPKGVLLVLLEILYSVTDPPLRLVRRFVRPLRLGPVQLDLAFLIVMAACILASWGLARL